MSRPDLDSIEALAQRAREAIEAGRLGGGDVEEAAETVPALCAYIRALEAAALDAMRIAGHRLEWVDGEGDATVHQCLHCFAEGPEPDTVPHRRDCTNGRLLALMRTP